MRRHGKTAVGVLISVLLLWWALRDVSAAEVVEEVRQADLLLLGAAILVSIAGFAFRAVRWGVLLRPLAPAIAFRPRFAAVIVGFAANNLLPARVGEFARALSLARLSVVSTAASFATLVVERLFDALVLVGLLFAAMAAPGFPVQGEIAGVDPRSAARVIALAVAAMGVALLLLVAAPHRSVRGAEAVASRLLPPRARDAVVAVLESFLGGLAVLRDARLFVVSVVLALAQWLFTAISYVLAFRAFGIEEVPFSGAVFLQSLIALAVAVPSSPGFFGPFEAAAKLGLALWGVVPHKAVSFAVGYHLGGFIPVTLMGIYYVWRLGLSWREVRHGDEAVEDRLDHRSGRGGVVHGGA